MTPEHWRYIRIVACGRKRVKILTFIAFVEVGPMMAAACGVDGFSQSRGITMNEALEVGEKIEKHCRENYVRRSGRAARKILQ